MKPLIQIKEELERKLSIINAALEIQREHGTGDETETYEPRGEVEYLSPADLESAILQLDGNFSAKDIPSAITKAFPGKAVHKTSIAVTLHKLVSSKSIQYVQKRSGRKGAIYTKQNKIKPS